MTIIRLQRCTCVSFWLNQFGSLPHPGRTRVPFFSRFSPSGVYGSVRGAQKPAQKPQLFFLFTISQCLAFLAEALGLGTLVYLFLRGPQSAPEWSRSSLPPRCVGLLSVCTHSCLHPGTPQASAASPDPGTESPLNEYSLSEWLEEQMFQLT